MACAQLGRRFGGLTSTSVSLRTSSVRPCECWGPWIAAAGPEAQFTSAPGLSRAPDQPECRAAVQRRQMGAVASAEKVGALAAGRWGAFSRCIVVVFGLTGALACCRARSSSRRSRTTRSSSTARPRAPTAAGWARRACRSRPGTAALPACLGQGCPAEHPGGAAACAGQGPDERPEAAGQGH